MEIKKILGGQSDFVDKMIIDNNPKLIFMVMSVYNISANKAKRLIKRYKQKYQYDKCEACGAYAVAMFKCASDWWDGCDFNRWDNGEAYWGTDRVERIELSGHYVYTYARICLECDELNEVFIEEPRKKVSCTSEVCERDSMSYVSTLIGTALDKVKKFDELINVNELIKQLKDYGFKV
jgi:hypothetical protein